MKQANANTALSGSSETANSAATSWNMRHSLQGFGWLEFFFTSLRGGTHQVRPARGTQSRPCRLGVRIDHLLQPLLLTGSFEVAPDRRNAPTGRRTQHLNSGRIALHSRTQHCRAVLSRKLRILSRIFGARAEPKADTSVDL